MAPTTTRVAARERARGCRPVNVRPQNGERNSPSRRRFRPPCRLTSASAYGSSAGLRPTRAPCRRRRHSMTDPLRLQVVDASTAGARRQQEAISQTQSIAHGCPRPTPASWTGSSAQTFFSLHGTSWRSSRVRTFRRWTPSSAGPPSFLACLNGSSAWRARRVLGAEPPILTADQADGRAASGPLAFTRRFQCRPPVSGRGSGRRLESPEG
jgi:hypothetical protein